MNKLVLLFIAATLVVAQYPLLAEAAHKNTLRTMIHESDLDLWAGEPNRRYEKLGDIKAGGDTSDEGMTDYVRNVLNSAMKDAIVMKADAIINLNCGGIKYPNDDGDFLMKNPWVAIAARPIVCTGQAVKYK